MNIEEVYISGESVVLMGETWITVDTDEATYEVLIEWTKLPDKFRVEDANITRVIESTSNENHTYENGEWENIYGWQEIEEAVWKKFDENFS